MIRDNESDNERNILVIVIERFSFKEKYVFTNYFYNKIKERGLKIIKVETPKDIINVIEENKNNIYGVYLFQDCICDSYLYDKSMLFAYDYFICLEKYNIKVFPDIYMQYLFSSKKYNVDFEKNYPQYSLPHTETLVFENFNSKTDIVKFREITIKCIKKMYDNNIKHIFLKKGFSYESKSVVKLLLTDFVSDEQQINECLVKLERVNNWKLELEISKYEDGLNRILIIQPYNKIVENRKNEFRCFFINGKFVNFFVNGDQRRNGGYISLPHIRYDNEDNNHRYMKWFAYNVYNNYIKKQTSKEPSIIRIDLSYAIDEFLDKYSVTINGEKRRYYVNEIENQPSFYFGYNFIHKTKKYKYDKYEYNVADALVDEIYNANNT